MKSLRNTSLPQTDSNHFPLVSHRDNCHQWRHSAPVPGRCLPVPKDPVMYEVHLYLPPSSASTPLLLRPPAPNLVMFCTAITSLMLNKVGGVAIVTSHPPMSSQVKE